MIGWDSNQGDATLTSQQTADLHVPTHALQQYSTLLAVPERRRGGSRKYKLDAVVGAGCVNKKIR